MLSWQAEGTLKNTKLGMKLDGEKTVSSGGRVLGVVSVKDSMEKAIEGAYSDVEKISFKDAFFRHDIGKKAIDIL